MLSTGGYQRYTVPMHIDRQAELKARVEELGAQGLNQTQIAHALGFVSKHALRRQLINVGLEFDTRVVTRPALAK